MVHTLKRIFAITLALLIVFLSACTAAPAQQADQTGPSSGLSAEASTAPGDNSDPEGDGILKVLMLGNSFSEDTAAFFWNIARDLGVEKVTVALLFIAGCDLKTHAQNVQGDLPKYTYQFNDSGEWVHTKDVAPRGIVEGENWDYIVLQQSSSDSGRPASYNNYLQTLTDYIQQARPKAKILWNMTWAYETTSDHWAFSYYNNDQITMYNAIVDTVNNTVLANKAIYGVIPCGTAVQNVRTTSVGSGVTRDGFHLSIPFGRYLAGLTMAGAIIDPTLDGLTWKPNELAGRYMEPAVAAAKAALANYYEITPIE